jgi:hypothetical protein
MVGVVTMSVTMGTVNADMTVTVIEITMIAGIKAIGIGIVIAPTSVV